MSDAVIAPADILAPFDALYVRGHQAGSAYTGVWTHETASNLYMGDDVAREVALVSIENAISASIAWIRGFEAAVVKTSVCTFCDSTEDLKSLSYGDSGVILFCPAHREAALRQIGVL